MVIFFNSRKMVGVGRSMKMATITKEDLRKVCLREKGFMFGRMELDIKVNLFTVSETEKVF